MYDLIIRNGTIIDGSGNPRYLGDVAVKDGRIEKLGTADKPIIAGITYNNALLNLSFIMS